ncbi:MAG: hypothetical protein IJM59_12035 [Proteobacteria bacterium]|nr:hypothetical protein [Pseudomonadota bacterium]
MSDNPIIKYTAKDSVFVDLFSIPRYLLELYQSLHPEDQLTTLQDLKTITLKSIIAEHPYNDLGFRVNHRYMILVEAQSTWTPNILIRAWNYLAQTYVDYFHEMNVSLYDNVNIQLPVPELYVIYTGSRKRKPRILRLSKSFFKGKIADIEVRIRIIYSGRKGSILNQYIRFCKIFTKQLKIHGRTAKAIQETIRICNQYRILTDYLRERETEIMNIMTALFDQEEVTKALVKSKEIAAEKKGKEDGFKLGKEDGFKLGKEDGFKLGKEDGETLEKLNTIRRCRKAGIPEKQIAEITGLTIEEINVMDTE